MSCIFVSYSRHDLDYVSGLVQALESYGLSAWTDKRMEGGERWLTEIRKQLQECQAFLVVVSPRSEASNWVQIEIATAMELNKELIYPVLLEGKLWFPLTGYQGVDVRDGSLPSDKFFEKVRKELAIVTAKSPKKNDYGHCQAKEITFTGYRTTLRYLVATLVVMHFSALLFSGISCF